ncbi:MAG: hypothetical protein ACTSSL_11625 [Candidatus Heimdallarchaeaceae archaeon]
MRRKEEKNVYTPFSVVFSALKCKWDKELGVLWLSIQLKGLDTDNSSFISGEYLGKKVLFFFFVFINYSYNKYCKQQTKKEEKERKRREVDLEN